MCARELLFYFYEFSFSCKPMFQEAGRHSNSTATHEGHDDPS